VSGNVVPIRRPKGSLTSRQQEIVLDMVARARTVRDADRARADAEFSKTIRQADEATVPIVHIAAAAGMSRTTIYKILESR